MKSRFAFTVLLSVCLLAGSLAPQAVQGQETVTSEPPAASVSHVPEEPCPKGKRGGAIAGIVIGSLFWTLLPMSIPVLITQGKKLKAHNRAKHERRCQYAPR